jgi:hypothetical protein
VRVVDDTSTPPPENCSIRPGTRSNRASARALTRVVDAERARDAERGERVRDVESTGQAQRVKRRPSTREGAPFAASATSGGAHVGAHAQAVRRHAAAARQLGGPACAPSASSTVQNATCVHDRRASFRGSVALEASCENRDGRASRSSTRGDVEASTSRTRSSASACELTSMATARAPRSRISASSALQLERERRRIVERPHRSPERAPSVPMRPVAIPLASRIARIKCVVVVLPFVPGDARPSRSACDGPRRSGRESRKRDGASSGRRPGRSRGAEAGARACAASTTTTRRTAPRSHGGDEAWPSARVAAQRDEERSRAHRARIVRDRGHGTLGSVPLTRAPPSAATSGAIEWCDAGPRS